MASHELLVEPQVTEIPRLLDWVEAQCGAERVGDDLRFKMALALEEAVTNVIKNAFVGLPAPHLIRVRLRILSASVVAQVIDNGHFFDPSVAPDPDLSLSLEQRTPGGLGIHLMRTMMDSLRYRRSTGNFNVLRLEKKARD